MEIHIPENLQLSVVIETLVEEEIKKIFPEGFQFHDGVVSRSLGLGDWDVYLYQGLEFLYSPGSNPFSFRKNVSCNEKVITVHLLPIGASSHLGRWNILYKNMPSMGIFTVDIPEVTRPLVLHSKLARLLRYGLKNRYSTEEDRITYYAELQEVLSSMRGNFLCGAWFCGVCTKYVSRATVAS